MSTNAVGLYVLCSFLPVLSTLAVGARLCVRNRKRQHFGVDDWTSLIGLVGLWGVAGVILDGARRGLLGGNSNIDPTTGALMRTWREGPNVKYSWIVPIVTVVTLAPIKLSVIFLYRRVFHISRFFHYYSIFLCVLLVIWAIAFFFASIFQCGTKPWAYWTTVETIKLFCDDTGGANVALCFSDLFIDVLILVAPLVMIWKMNFSLGRKIQILTVFALGFVSTAAAAARVYIMWHDAYDTKRGFTNLIRENTKVVMWCLIEISSALIACCLPVLRPILADMWTSRIVRSIQDKLFYSQDSTCPLNRELEEGRAFHSIGGTDFRVVQQRKTISRNDSKLSATVDSRETNFSQDADKSMEELDPTLVETKEIRIGQP